MPNTIEYSDSPNVETAFVVREDGKKNRAVLTAAQDTSTLEYPTNPNSTKGYVTIDGKKHRVVLTANIAGSSGDQHNLGYYTTQAALEEAHPTAEAGDWAIVGATDTVWVWDEDTSAWVDTDQKGQVTSVNGKTGVVVLTAKDVSAVPQYTTIPTASASNEGEICQFVGTTDSNYTNGYFYKCVANYSEASATVAQTAGSGITDVSVDVDTFVAKEQPTGNKVRVFFDMFVSATESLSPENLWFPTTLDENAYITVDMSLFFASLKTAFPDMDNVLIPIIKYTYDTDNGLVFHLLLEDGTEYGSIPAANVSGLTMPAGDPFYGVVEGDEYHVYPGDNWYITQPSDKLVRISEYGVTYSGTPTQWSALTVTYTAPALTGYTWERVDVQPAPEGGDFVPQLTSMPVASASNAGQLVQYKGADTNDYTNGYFYQSTQGQEEGTATISQTVGNADSVSFETTVGTTEISGTTNAIRTFASDRSSTFGTGTLTFVFESSNNWWNVAGQDSIAGATTSFLTNDMLDGYGFVITGTPSDGDTVVCTYNLGNMWNLAVNVATFETQESTTGNYNFVADVTTDSITITTINGWDIGLTDVTSILNEIEAQYPGFIDTWTEAWINYIPDENNFIFGMSYSGGTGQVTITPWVSIITQGSANEAATVDTMTMSSVTWKKDNVAVNLTDYGISYSGEPLDDDTLTVAYTEGAIVYSWEQINVQPEGQQGIEWVTTVDLPADSGLGWDAYPIYTIAGGLPQGTYEFYWQIMDFCAASNGLPAVPLTYKARFIINQDNYCYGSFMPVIDGEYFTNGNNILQSWSWMSPFKVSNGDWLLYNPDYQFWKSGFPAYASDTAVPECFKISAIVNVNTGEKIIPTGRLSDGNSPIYDSEIYGNISCQKLAQDPYIPVYFSSNTVNYDDNTQYFRIMNNGISTSYGKANCCEIDVAFESDSGGRYHVIVENGITTYTATVIDASGDLANAQIGYTDNNEVFVYLNTTAGTTGSAKVNVGCKGAAGDTPSIYGQQPSSFTQAIITEVGGTIAINTIGKILQYTGTTNVNYTHGYFYEATGTVVTTPASMTAEDINPNDFSITIDLNNLIPAIQNYTGWATDYIENTLVDQQSWKIYYDADNSSINHVFWSGYGEFYDSSIINCFTATTTGTYSGEVSVDFTGDYTPQTTVVQNPAWVQVNTQPGATTPSTMPTLTVAGWSSNTQTVTVNGVTTTNNVLVAPAPASSADWTSAGVICTAQGTDSLTFTCTQTPSNDITVNVCILG